MSGRVREAVALEVAGELVVAVAFGAVLGSLTKNGPDVLRGVVACMLGCITQLELATRVQFVAGVTPLQGRGPVAQDPVGGVSAAAR